MKNTKINKAKQTNISENMASQRNNKALAGHTQRLSGLAKQTAKNKQ